MPDLFLWVIGTAIVLMLLGSLIAWLVAEHDERRWRRKLREQQQAVLIRQRRYGDMHGGHKHD